MQFLKKFFRQSDNTSFARQLKNVLGVKSGNVLLYRTALSHRSVKETADENNERLEYLGDAVLSAVVADYLFKRYPYKGEGFLTEMRSKMVNRQQLNDIALKMGLRKLTFYNKFDKTFSVLKILERVSALTCSAKWVHVAVENIFYDDLWDQIFL